MRLFMALIVFVLSLPGAGRAQSFAEHIAALAARAPDLKFPDEAKSLSFFSAPGMSIFKPDGAGPFPAVVLVHTCGGLRWRETREWVKEVLTRGYVAFVQDSLGPRGVTSVCNPPTTVTIWRGAKDALQARGHLEHFPFVDKDRIAVMGFSWGAIVALLASSKAVTGVFSPEKRFAAAVSLYPACRSPSSGEEWLRADTDRPTLVMMGELDNETPPADCLPLLEELKARGAPVAWKLYPATTHCWDCFTLDGLNKIDYLGNRVTYKYDKEVTADSTRRAFEFLNEAFKMQR